MEMVSNDDFQVNKYSNHLSQKKYHLKRTLSNLCFLLYSNNR